MTPSRRILCGDETIEGLSQRGHCGRIAPRLLGHCAGDCVEHLVGLNMRRSLVHFMGHCKGKCNGPLNGRVSCGTASKISHCSW
jgi:hypothetical protein